MDTDYQEQVIQEAILKHIDDLAGYQVPIDEKFFEAIARALDSACREQNIDQDSRQSIYLALDRVKQRWLTPTLSQAKRKPLPMAV